MTKVVLISCVSKKLPYKAKAKDIYTSPLFKMNLKFANSFNPDKIFILSAKYGLVKLEEEIEPYNKTLNNMSDEEIKEWSNKVIKKLKENFDLEKDDFIFLAGERYRRYLIKDIKNYKIPLKGLGIGKQLKFLKENVSYCERVHKLFNSMERLKFPFNEEKIPLNGIYVLFEKGEKGHGNDRIVRVGTHTGQDQLKSRLKQHFIDENKDRSIFRKNIGRALLNKDNDDYLEKWEIDLTTKEAKGKFSKLIDLEKQKEIEKRVSKYIQENFSFVVFRIDNKDKRLELEAKLISTISLCKDCKASENWLGLNSTIEKIRESGLWLVQELYKEPLSSKDFLEIN